MKEKHVFICWKCNEFYKDAIPIRQINLRESVEDKCEFCNKKGRGFHAIIGGDIGEQRDNSYHTKEISALFEDNTEYGEEPD